jgi:hypothetical protein
MSDAEATRFIDSVLSDEAFSNELIEMKDDPDAIYAFVRSRGFDVTAEEVRDALLENLAHQLPIEQLQDIAAGKTDPMGIAIGVTGSVLIGAVFIGVSAASAAAV